jgi:hypothetical protein
MSLVIKGRKGTTRNHIVSFQCNEHLLLSRYSTLSMRIAGSYLKSTFTVFDISVTVQYLVRTSEIN